MTFGKLLRSPFGIAPELGYRYTVTEFSTQDISSKNSDETVIFKYNPLIYLKMSIITARYWGRTGNMLFQIAAAIYYSDKMGRPFLLSKCREFPNLDNHSPESIGIDSAEFSDSLMDFSEEEIANGVPFPENRNIKLTGFYQNWKMVEECRMQLFDVVGIRDIRNNVLPVIQSPEFESRGLFLSTTSTISLHIRRGDYEQLACYFLLLNEYYYKGALLNIANRMVGSNKINVLCFYEKASSESAKKIIDSLVADKDLSTFPFEYYHFNDLLPISLTDVEELAVISHCDHNIIANSTFSWWAAYIGNNRQQKDRDKSSNNSKKIVCYPDEYFNHQLHYLSNAGLKVDGWTEIKAWNPDERKCECLW